MRGKTMFVVRLVFPFWLSGLAGGAASGAFLIGIIVGASSGLYEMPFYEATAQIIPVLLLVLAVEARFFRINQVPFKVLRQSFEAEMKEALGDEPSLRDAVVAAFAIQTGRSFAYVQQRLLMVLVLAALVAGEVISILILGQPARESRGLQGVVMGATFAGLAAVVIAALTGPMPVEGESPENRTKHGKD
jgi:hypothetical protein